MAHFVAEMASRLATVEPNALGQVVEQILEWLGSYTAVDRCYIVQLSACRRLMSTSHGWCLSPLEAGLNRLQNFPVVAYPWLMGQLDNRQVVHVPDVALLPAAASAEQQILQEENVRSLLLLPIIADSLKGFLGFEAVHANRQWSPEEIALLQVAASVLGLAIKNSEQRDHYTQQVESVRSSCRLMARQLEDRQVGHLASLASIAGGMAHQINNPNSLIALNGPLLEEIMLELLAYVAEQGEEKLFGGFQLSELPAIIKDLFYGIDHASQRITKIINHLTDFAKQDLSYCAGPTDLFQALNKALFLVDGELQKRDITVTRRFETIPSIAGSETHMTQVFVNLLQNSICAMTTQPREVILSGFHDDRQGEVVVLIQDSGSGMGQDIIDKAFEPFFTTRQNNSAAGLGLSVAYGIVTAHAGTIRLSSEEGKGTNVELRFSVAKEQVSACPA